MLHSKAGNFCQFHHLPSIAIHKFSSCKNGYRDDAETLTNINFGKCFCNTKVAGLGKTFLQQKFSATLSHTYPLTTPVVEQLRILQNSFC